MSNIIPEYLKLIGISTTKEGFQHIIDSVPNIDTMYGLNSILNHYNIENYCIKTDCIDDLDENDYPCIILFRGDFVILKKYFESKVILELKNGKIIVIDVNDFIKEWNGVALIAKPNRNSKEPDFVVNRKIDRFHNLKKTGLLITLTIIILIGILTNDLKTSLWFWLLLVVNCAGLAISFLLLQKQLHVENHLTDRLCGLIKDNNCDEVIDSSGSVIWGDIKFAEIGSGFFVTNLFCQLFIPYSIYYLNWIAILVLPFTFWSLWYQKYKIRAWCVLCLIILGTMWIQAIIYYVGGFLLPVQEYWVTLCLIIAIYVFSTLSINITMKGLGRIKENSFYREKYNSLKFRPEIVKYYLDNALEFDTSEEVCSSLIFGNREAMTKITIFSNPYCGPCASLHRKLSNIPWNNVCINYVMTFFSDELSDINKYIIAYYQKFGETKTWEVLSEWYSGGKDKRSEFFSKYDLPIESESVRVEFEKQKNWIKDERLYGTPMVLYNGKEIKSPYTLEDFMFNSL